MKKMHFYGSLLIAAVALFLGSGCSTIPGGLHVQISVDRGDTVTIHDMTDKTGWGQGTHMYLTRISPQRIAMTYWVAGDGGLSGRSTLDWPGYSDDEGRTWQFGDPFSWEAPPEVDFPLSIKKGDPFSNFNMGTFFSATTFTNGTRVLFSHDARLHTNPRFVHITSTNNGLAWSPPDDSTVIFPETMTNQPTELIFEGEAQVTEDGRLLTTGFGRAVSKDKHSTFLFESKDAGRTLTYVSTVATPAQASWGSNGAAEPALLKISSNELICIMRTGIYSGTGDQGNAIADSLLHAYSDDLGLTWKLRRMTIPGVMPKLRRLNNGVIVLATGRPGNSLYFSSDNGHSFGREETITAPHIKTTGYCDFIEVSPNRIFVVYDIINSPLQKLWLWEPTIGNGIYGTFYDVSLRFGGK